MTYSINDIKSFLTKEGSIECFLDIHTFEFQDVLPITDCHEKSLVFIDRHRKDKPELAERTKAKIIICDFDVSLTDAISDKLLIKTKHPKLLFTKIANAFFVKRPAYGIHPNAFIHPEAKIHPESYIGAFTYVGKSTVGKGTIIYGNVNIYDNITIGENVIIHAGTAIGSDGYGYVREENGFAIQFPHIGQVVIEDYVEIGSNTSIDLGTLGATKIGYGSKIDNLVHIGHNVQIGEHVFVAAQTTIAGSSRIGDYSEIWTSVAIADMIKIGTHTSIGMGSVVIKDVPDGKKVFGNPARVYADNI